MIRDMFEKKHRRACIIIDNILLLVLAIYLFFQSELTTTLRFSFGEKFEISIFIVLFILVLLKIIAVWESDRDVLMPVCFLFGMVYYLSWVRTEYIFLLFIALFTIGLQGVDYRKILRVYLLAVGTSIIGAVLASLCGSITNFVYINRGLRSSWGIGFPTDFATGLLFLLIIAFCLFLNIKIY